MRKKHMVSDQNDFISKMPNNVCTHIVSLLPLKDAMITSVLSTRWRYVWATCPSLNFDFSEFPEVKCRKHAFINYIENAIEKFNGEELQRFRVSLLGYGGPVAKLNDWIQFAVDQQVQKLELCLPRWRDFQLSDSIFKCPSISVLILNLSKYAEPLPSTVGLIGLKKLHIESVIAPNVGQFLKELCSSSLQLEELYVGDFSQVNFVDIDAPSLKIVTFHNVDWVHPVPIRISAPQLKSFSYIGRPADFHDLSNASILDDVKLELSHPSLLLKTEEECQSSLVQLLQMIGNARALTISQWCIKNLYGSSNMMEKVFDSVTELILCIAPQEASVEAISPFLVICPNVVNLSVLVKPCSIVRKSHNSSSVHLQEHHIEGMTKHLASIKLESLDENKSGIELIKFLLKNAVALQKMLIATSVRGLDLEAYKSKVSRLVNSSRAEIIEYHTK